MVLPALLEYRCVHFREIPERFARSEEAVVQVDGDTEERSLEENNDNRNLQILSSSSLHRSQAKQLKEMVRIDVALVVSEIIPDLTKFTAPLSDSMLKAAGAEDKSDSLGLFDVYNEGED